MEKIFNNEIVDLLRSKNRTKVQDMLYQDGDKYIWKKPDSNKEAKAKATSSAIKKALTSSLSFSSDPMIALYPESNKTSLSSGTDVSTLLQFQPAFRGSSYSRVKCRKHDDLEKLLQKNYEKHEEVTRIRALLGPFPDEPFMMALDRILFFLIGLCGRRIQVEPTTSESSVSESESNVCTICDKPSTICEI